MPKQPPCATLVIETLVARYRAGDPSFTFDKRLTNVMRGLAAQGIIGYKDGPAGGWLAWFASDEVRDRYLHPGYRSTVEIERDKALEDLAAARAAASGIDQEVARSIDNRLRRIESRLGILNPAPRSGANG
jgi:hypothetical protein